MSVLACTRLREKSGERPTHALAKTHLLRQGVDDPRGEGAGEAELRTEQQSVEVQKIRGLLGVEAKGVLALRCWL